MKRCKLFIVLLLFLFSAALLYSRNVHLSVQTGHSSSVNIVSCIEAAGLLFSGSDDGTVRLWDIKTKTLIRKIYVSHLPVYHITVFEKERRFAAVSGTGRNTMLSVRDWTDGSELFAVPLEETPLFVKFSPKGSFIAAGFAKWNSLQFFDGETGKRLPYLGRGFGIVSFVFISDSERTLGSYNPSTGSIIYWDVQSGDEKTRRQTIQNLELLREIDDEKRYVAAKNGKELVIIDTTTGAAAARSTVGAIENIAVDKLSGNIACLYTEGDACRIANFRFYKNSTYLSKQYVPAGSIDMYPNDFAFFDDFVYLGHSTGEITVVSVRSGSSMGFSKNELQPITGVNGRDKFLLLASEDRLLILSSDFFSDTKNDIPEITYLEGKRTANPIDGRTRIEYLNYNNYLLWNNDEKNGNIYTINPETGFIDDLYTDFNNPLISLDVFRNSVISLEKSGRLTVRNIYNSGQEFEYQSLGMKVVSGSTYNGVIAGKNISNFFETPILKIDTATGETVGLESKNFIVFSLAYNSSREWVYSLGLSRSADGAVSTRLSKHWGSNLERSTLIAAVSDEDLNADIAVDDADSSVYSSMGHQGIKTWDRNDMPGIPFESNNALPRRVMVENNAVYAINRDGSVSIWSKKTGDHLLDFYLFKDSSWLAVSAGGYFLESEHGYARRFLKVIEDDKLSSRALDRYEFKLSE